MTDFKYSRWLKWGWRWICSRANLMLGGIFAGWMVGQIFKDRFWITGLLFFFPSILLLGMLLCKTIYEWWNLRSAGRWISAALFPLAVVLLIENQWERPQGTPPQHATLRIVHWNVYGGGFGWENLCDVLKPLNPDLMVLSEVHPRTRVPYMLRNLGPEYQSLRFSNMVIFAKGRLFREAPVTLSEGSAGCCTWIYRGEELKLVVVDLPSRITLPRDGLLKEVLQVVQERRPQLVLGDFNAPRLSRQLCRLPVGYRHAYDAAGRGWSASWPVRWPMYTRHRTLLERFLAVPLWAIDQCVVGPGIEPVRYELQTTDCSDHRLQYLECRRMAVPRISATGIK